MSLPVHTAKGHLHPCLYHGWFGFIGELYAVISLIKTTHHLTISQALKGTGAQNCAEGLISLVDENEVDTRTVGALVVGGSRTASCQTLTVAKCNITCIVTRRYLKDYPELHQCIRRYEKCTNPRLSS
ncbi:hypothetical protein OE88DRAFT_378474 [Heliocybe sulcata]|uniref:Uncharacterized protein n=1 Tax=Heliocybe sulcata TaxID=5364 RepID=A0A5C3N146_9AGAM|nr:hypothetical protein OE88DRAFT_378474 [Heliocybe sulcata]